MGGESESQFRINWSSFMAFVSGWNTLLVRRGANTS